MTEHEQYARERVIEIAQYEIDNHDGDPSKYWDGVGVPRPYPRCWCGAFALWCLRQASLTDWPWTVKLGFAYRLIRTKNPKPGDVAYFKRKQHHALVKTVDGPKLWTLDGNQDPDLFVNRMAVRERKVSDAAAYYSIQSLIDATEPVA